MRPADSSSQIKHLFSRATFGITYPELQKMKGWDLSKIVDQLFTQSGDYDDLPLPDTGLEAKGRRSLKVLTEDEKKVQLRNARQRVRLLNTTWLQKMASSPAQLREKLTLFWHGHFACRSTNAAFLHQLNHIHRKHALGDFRTMLLEVSRSPAMLQFLNNQQNRKGSPNENFARELMELFTIGRGHYTENDVKEAARAFTGWGYNQKGQFQFREVVHDEGEKTFFGKQGNFDGTDIIDRLLEKPETANFIARKVYAFLVSDNIDEQRVQQLGAHFYKSNYNITELVKKILNADWFYEPSVMGLKIKSPVELLAGINRQFDVRYQNPDVLLKFQSALGQMLFYPPNVAGWPGGRSWIDSSSLMVRLKIPSLILSDGLIDFESKGDIEDESLIALTRVKGTLQARQVQATPDWNSFLTNLPPNMPVKDLAGFLLQPSVSPATLNTIEGTTNMKSIVVALLSLPEYQMC